MQGFKHKLLAAFAALLLPATLLAQTFNLAPGDTKKISFDKKIDTVFVTDQNIANYKILSDKTLLLYGLTSGTTTMNVLGEDDKSLLDATILVTELGNLINTNRQLKMQLPKSDLKVTRVGDAYVLDGKARDQEELATAQRILALATGGEVTAADGNASIGSNDLGKDLFKKYEYANVVNNAELVQTNQINVRLTVVEVDRSVSQSLGINWSSPRVGLINGNLSGGSLGFQNGLTSLGFSAGNLSAFISALDDRTVGKVLSEPNLSMLSGEVSRVLIGGEIPFVERTSDTSTVEYKPYGIGLTVGAKVQPNGRIRVALHQKVSDIVPSSDESKLPGISLTESEAMFEVANGESFIIGGLYSKKHSENVKKVPFLGDLPILGSFFRSVANGDQEKELIIVATVNMVKPVNEKEIQYPNIDEIGVVENYFNLRPINDVYKRTQVTNFLKRGGFIQ